MCVSCVCMCGGSGTDLIPLFCWCISDCMHEWESYVPSSPLPYLSLLVYWSLSSADLSLMFIWLVPDVAWGTVSRPGDVTCRPVHWASRLRRGHQTGKTVLHTGIYRHFHARGSWATSRLVNRWQLCHPPGLISAVAISFIRGLEW